MGFEVKADYFYVYYEEGQYCLECPDNVREMTKGMIMNMLYSINYQSLNQCNWENYKEVLEKNFFFFYMEDCILLFKKKRHSHRGKAGK